LLFYADPNHFYNRRCLVPHKGRIAIVTNAGRDVVDAAVLGVRCERRADCSPWAVSGMQDDGAACGRWSRVVL